MNEAFYKERISELEEAIREILYINDKEDYSSGYDVIWDITIKMLRKVLNKNRLKDKVNLSNLDD